MKQKNFQTRQDHFPKNTKGVSKIYPQVFLLMKFLQTKPEVKIIKINYFDLYCTIIKVRDENEDIDNQYEDDDYINFNDFITPNHNISIKPREIILRWRSLRSYINHFKIFILCIKRRKMNSRNCDVCNIDVHRATYVKHLRSKKHLENIKQNEMIIPEWLFKEPIETKINKKYNPKSLKQIARDNIRLDDKQVNQELAKRCLILINSLIEI